MNHEFMRLLVSKDDITIGEAAAQAQTAIENVEVRQTWILFGDPSTRLK